MMRRLYRLFWKLLKDLGVWKDEYLQQKAERTTVYDRRDIISNCIIMKWASHRQMKLEGGFQGRTNKLVDGCYSFWVGGLFPLLYTTLSQDGGLGSETWHFQQDLLQKYILMCCQSLFGGLIDKPGKSSDYYHTCYCLSGLSISQHCFGSLVNITNDKADVLAPVNPIYNISLHMANQAIQYYIQRDKILIEQD